MKYSHGFFVALIVAVSAISCAALFFHPAAAQAASQCGLCPQQYCEDPALAQKLKARKKAAAEAQGLPKRLSALYDKLDNCQACIEQAQPLPHIIWVYDQEKRAEIYGEPMPTHHMSREWNAEREQKARDDMRDGIVKSIHFTIGSKPCKCCKARTREEIREWEESTTKIGLGNDPLWNDRLQVYDEHTINITDNKQLGEDPEDLSKLPPLYDKPAPEPKSIESFLKGGPERVMQVQCQACKGLAADYNKAGEGRNTQRMLIAEINRDIAHDRAMIKYLRFQNDGFALIGQSKKTTDQVKANEQAVLGHFAAIKERERALKRAETEYSTLAEKMNGLMQAVKACGKEKCPPPVKTDNVDPGEEPEIFYLVGGSILPSEPKTVRPIREDIGEVYNAKPKEPVREQWKDITTACKPCKGLVKEYNRMMREVYFTRYAIARADYLRTSFNEEQRDYGAGVRTLHETGDDFSDDRASGFTQGGFQNAMLLGHWLQQDEAYENYVSTLKGVLKEYETLAGELGSQLQACEKQCKVETEEGRIIIGSGGEIKTTQTALPFDWRGPYSAGCWKCEKLAAELNRLPDMVRERQVDIIDLKLNIKWLEAERALAGTETSHTVGVTDVLSSKDKDWNGIPDKVDRIDKSIENAKVSILKKQDEITLISRQFATVSRMLQECEAEYCKDKEISSLPPVIELEQVISVFGFNPFDPYQVETILFGDMDTAVTPVTPVTPTTPIVTPPGTPPVTPPTATPLVVTASGSYSFVHTVGSSPCPQAAGTASISSNNGNPLTVSGVTDSGTIASRLDQTVSGSGTATPSIAARFNCSSAQVGSYSGTVSATVTDTVTGESQGVSISASGQVN